MTVADLAGGADDGDPHPRNPNGPALSRPTARTPRAAAHGLLDPIGAHHAREADRRGRDHLDVDGAAVASDLEHGGGHAGVAAHPRADERHLGDAVVGQDLARADLGRQGPGHLEAGGEVGLGDGEGDVGRAVQRHVLHDDVDVDGTVGQRPEQPGRDAGLVGDTGHGHLGLGRVVGDGGDDGLLHGRVLLDDPGAGLPGEAGTDVQRHAVVAGELDRSQRQARGRRWRRCRASPRS